MTIATTATLTHGRSQADEYGLSAIAEHNATGTEQFPTYAEDGKGLGIYVSIALLSISRTLTDRTVARWVCSSLPRWPCVPPKPANSKPK
jgi:hypothetical protein